MIRAILGIVIGYVVLVLVTAVSLTVVWNMLGESGAFIDDTWTLSPKWAAIHMLVVLIAGIVGGFVCRIIARRRTFLWIFAAIVLALGVAGAVGNAMMTRSASRPDDLTMMTAVNTAQQPTYMLLLVPVLSTLGVTIGGGLRSDSRAPVSG